MQAPDNIFYTKEHEWVRIENKLATMGITDYAQSSLGDITFIELPKAGDVLKQFKQCATVESVKAASDVYAPLSGAVVKVNENLSQHPELINQSPYENGWFIVIEIKDEKEKDSLLSGAQYEEYVKGLSQ